MGNVLCSRNKDADKSQQRREEMARMFRELGFPDREETAKQIAALMQKSRTEQHVNEVKNPPSLPTQIKELPQKQSVLIHQHEFGVLEVNPESGGNPEIATGCLITCCALIIYQKNKKAVLAHVDDRTAIAGSMAALLGQFKDRADLTFDVIVGTKIEGAGISEDPAAEDIRKQNISSIKQAFKAHGIYSANYHQLPPSDKPLCVSFFPKTGEMNFSNSWNNLNIVDGYVADPKYISQIPNGTKTYLIPKTQVLDSLGNSIKSEQMLDSNEQVMPALKTFYTDHKNKFFQQKTMVLKTELKTLNHADSLLEERGSLSKTKCG